jgi:hypothetical protein
MIPIAKRRFFSARALTTLVSIFVLPLAGHASLALYDASISADETGAGPVPLAKLTSAVSFNGSNNSAFDFGANSGAVTMEFVVEGDPIAGGQDGFLAVGSNSTSSLRYEQWNDSGQLGFTQSGVADYLFSPLVLSPTEATHVTYVWDGDGRMDLYLDGTMVGQSTGVSGAFAMPTGNGLLGNNSGNSEGMIGTVHRVTVYNEAIDPAAISRHADAYNDVTFPPTINDFSASPGAYLAPGSSTLSWNVSGADTLSINGTDVTALSELVVSPAVTTIYTLTATNGDGTGEETVTVTVNPAPVIASFSADRTTINSGESVTFSWQTEFATSWSISPAPGDVSTQTAGGNGSVSVSPGASTTYTLTAGSDFGSVSADVTVRVAMVATHPVIAEFMADNETGLTDGDGEFSDWIEIFNPTGAAIDLAGYFLTDDASELTLWAFPSHLLAPGARVLVFASGKHPLGPVGELHTNFRLNRGGEYLALVAPDGTTLLHAFTPVFPSQSNDVSYGILGGDLSAEQFMGVPTPGAANDSTPPAPAAVVISVPSQTFTGSLSVALSSATGGATIYYTTNGSQPSSANGMTYSSPVVINATTHLRAVAEFGDQVGPVSGETYIRLAADLANYESDLPLMVIDNFGAGTIPAKGWSGTGSGVGQVARQSAVWATFDRDPGTGMARLADAPQMISRSGVRGRGAFSSTWRQKPYSMEVWDESAGEKNVEVLGMPAHSDWTLYYPDIDSNKDPSMMFNTFMYELSNNIGRYAARIRWVEAFVNENGGDLSLADRRGVYAIFEKVSRGNGRLDFQRLSEDGTTGGWLLGLNRMDSVPVGGFPAENGVTQPQFFHTKGPNRTSQTSPNSSGGGDDIPRQSNGFLNFDNPGGYKINTQQRAAIEGWFDTFEDVLYDNSQWLDPVNGYHKYLDAQDFVEYFIFNNLSRNGDGMLISMFPWKGDDGKLRMGPAWDYNWSSYYISGSATGTKWHRRDRLWYGRLFTDPDFEQLYIDRWFYHRDRGMSNSAIEAIIDGQSAEIGLERALRQGYGSEAAWTGQLNTHKNWLTTRSDWYDGQFTARPVFNQAGGEVEDGFVVAFSPPPGTIYFTTDGSDPRAPGGGVAAGVQQYEGGVLLTDLVSEGDAVRVLIPTLSNPPAGLGWTLSGFIDGAWIPGATGVGYDRVTTYDAHINLNLDATMDGENTSAYLRIEFEVEDASIYDVLNLKMKYDDGFIAYLNGVEIASDNAPGSPDWESESVSDHPDGEAVTFVNFPVSDQVGELVSGTNVLAIHGLNGDIGSSDFLISPELQAGQSTVASGLELNDSTLITARTQVGAAWSAPADAFFFIGTVPADATNLVISKFHYRPADASSAEITAGFPDRDDYEFVELMNSGAQTLNLTDVRFTSGITFDFSTTNFRTLAPGQRLLLVNDLAAVELRYGTGFANQIAGEYSGNLSNDGELLTLIDATDAVIHSFTYNDQSPWPEGPDGDGFSLVLIAPGQSPVPDHSDPFNWRASIAIGGSPGGSDATDYASWKAANGVPTPEIDLDVDNDGRVNFLEYLEGTIVGTPDKSPGMASIENLDVGGAVDAYFVFRFQRNLAADDVIATAQLSSDLATWDSGAGVIVFLGRERVDATTEVFSFRSASPVATDERKFARVRAALR